MVKLGSNVQFSDRDQADVIVSICSLGLMLCMVVVVVGIKFRWFKQRLTFEQLPNDPSGSADNGQVTLKSSRSSQEQIRNPVMVQGVFRKKLDEDVMIERPKILPPIRIRKSSKGPPTFGPPKRNATTSLVVEEPVVVPPPPPPLPSASSLSLSSLGKISQAKTPPAEEKKVYFNSTVPVIVNGEANQTYSYEELKTEEDQNNRQYTERRATGYIRPSSEIAQVLKEQRNNEKPQAQPRTTTTERPKTSFKKNIIRTNTESLDVEEDQSEHFKMGQRRLTGFFGPSEEDLKALGSLDDSESDLDSNEKLQPKVKFALDIETEDDEDEDDNDDEEELAPPLPPTSPPPLLFSSQVSTEDNRSSTDSWSAIQRHRNLAQEISEQHEAMQNRRRENAEAANPVSVPEFRNPLAAQQLQQPKPRTMRDMKRNNAKNDLLLDGERDDTEA